MWLRLRAEGVAGHGSQPHGQNPNEHLMKALSRLFAEPVAAAPFPVVDLMKQRIGSPLAANKFNNAIQQSTISLTSLRSGVGDPPKVNVIPSVAEATLDCRLLPGTTAEQWIKEIERRLADPAIRIEVVYAGEDPVVSTQDAPLYRALESAIKRQHPDAIVTPMTVPYGTDANGFRPRGVKSYGIFPASFDPLDARRRGVHADRRAWTRHSHPVRRLEGNGFAALTVTAALTARRIRSSPSRESPGARSTRGRSPWQRGQAASCRQTPRESEKSNPGKSTNGSPRRG